MRPRRDTLGHRWDCAWTRYEPCDCGAAEAESPTRKIQRLEQIRYSLIHAWIWHAALDGQTTTLCGLDMSWFPREDHVGEVSSSLKTQCKKCRKSIEKRSQRTGTSAMVVLLPEER